MSQQEAELIEVKPEFMGFHDGDYPGAFPPFVSERIRLIVESPCLHLFSGSSKIGDVRVDLNHPNATIQQDVYQFIQSDKRQWKFIVLDPDYHIQRKHIKLTGHARTDSVAGNVLAIRLLEDYFATHTENILWFDMCAPKPPGFIRHKTWLYLCGGYKTVRVLSWLKRQGQRLDTVAEEAL